MAHLQHPDLVIVDCRFALSDPALGQGQYAQGHLPGAFYLDLNQDLSGPVQPHGGRHPLPDLQTLIPTLERCGIRSDPATPVVIYDDFRGAFAARLWWLLTYLGHGTAAVLQGGFSGWQRAGYPITTLVPTARQGRMAPQVQTEWVRTYDQVRAEQDHITLVDARSPARFQGQEEPIDPVAGSIPGAINAFWQTVVDEQGYFLDPAALRTHWEQIPLQRPPVMYCGSGVTACVNLLSRVAAGYPISPLYVGGWSDWCSYL
jgi:thiosulfate/3-mercaptopyruvate sulfurtransferase